MDGFTMFLTTLEAIKAALFVIAFTLNLTMSLTVPEVITIKHVLVFAQSGYMLLMLFKSTVRSVMVKIGLLTVDRTPPVRVKDDDTLDCCCCNEIVVALNELALTVSLKVSSSTPAFMSSTN